MKRVALTSLVLAGLVSVWAWQRPVSPSPDESASIDGSRETVSGGRSGQSEVPRIQATTTPPDHTNAQPRDEHATHDEATVSGAVSAAERVSPEPGEAAPTDDTVERAPLERYQDNDALALRRGRQIELVTRAQEQAHEALEEAEGSGDTERAARTRGVLRRLRLRLDALEAAASAVEPY